MRILNELSTGPVYWRMFQPWDRAYWVGIGEGVVQPGQNIGPLSNPGGTFKLELKRGGVLGPFIVAAGPVYSEGQEWVLRDDGRLEIASPPVVVPPTRALIRRVQGYDPARDSFAFPNRFPFSSFPVQEIAGFRLTTEAFGLCGGMVYAVIDYFLAGRPIPSRTDIPTGGPFFDYLWRRLLDSFNLPFGPGAPLRYLQLMSPALADAGPPDLLGVRSRMEELVNIEWPAIRSDIDAGRLSPIAFVLYKTQDSAQIFNNHQVLVHGYEERGPAVTLLISDPNHPRKEATLEFRTDDINLHQITYSEGLNAGAKLWALFRTAYSSVNPPEVTGPAWDSGWRSLGRMSLGGPDLASMNDKHLAVFSRGLDSALWCSELSGEVWTGPASLGGILTADPGSVSWGENRIDVFGRGTDGELWQIFRDGPIGSAWSGWVKLGGSIIGGPDVCSWAQGRLDVFARGTDDALWHRWYEGGWSDWESLGGVLTSDPTAVSWGPGRIDVFARGGDMRLWHRWYEGGWYDWEPLGGILSSAPDACSWGANRLDIFVRGTDKAIHQLCYDNGWTPWQFIGGSVIADPSAVSPAPNRISVVATGEDFGLWIKNFG